MTAFFLFGYRPFYTAAVCYSIILFSLWFPVFNGLMPENSPYGPFLWHAHEMLFGFSGAILSGFLLTVVPNWTGMLPPAPRTLFLAFCLWLIGRLSMLYSDILPLQLVAGLDMLFLPFVAFICTRNVVISRKWRDIKVIASLFFLILANALFHLSLVVPIPFSAANIAISAYMMQVIVIGGRMIASYARDWLRIQARGDVPPPHGWVDTAAIFSAIIAFSAWCFNITSWVAPVAYSMAFFFNLWRLWRWRAWKHPYPAMIAILNIGYLFLVIGLGALIFSYFSLIAQSAVIHIFTIGAMGVLVLGAMGRICLRYIGAPQVAERSTKISYCFLIACVITRVAADLFPDRQEQFYLLSSGLWCAAYILFLAQYRKSLKWAGFFTTAKD